MKKNIVSATLFGTTVNLFVNGAYHQKSFDTPELAMDFFKLCQKAKNEPEYFEEFKNSLNKLHKIEVHGIFEKDNNNNFYLKKTETPIPTLLIDTIMSYIDNKLSIDPLVKFWKLCLINPDKRVRQDLFQFLSNYNFAITDEGMFIAYKTVTHKDIVNNNLIDFVSNQWLKIKKWKKSPKNYTVIEYVEKVIEEEEIAVESEWIDDDTFEEGGYYTTTEIDEPIYSYSYSNKVVDNYDLERLKKDGKVKKVFGNLDEMYKNIETMIDEVEHTLYTDKYSKTMDIRIGLPVRQERKKCDKDPKKQCSNGLHVGSTKYVEAFSREGDSFLACYVNPMNVIAVPEYDNSKMRVCEYFPFAKLERLENGMFETLETNYFESDYINMEKGELEKLYTKMLESENPLEYESNESVKEKMELIKERLIEIK